MTFKYICEYNTITCILQIDFKDVAFFSWIYYIYILNSILCIMELQEAIRERHSVRQYINKPLTESVVTALNNKIHKLNKESGLHIQFVTNEPKAFSGFLPHFAKFSGISNYFAMVGRQDVNMKEKCGYYGEQLVLYAQQLGLNTCWSMTFSKAKEAYELEEDEKLYILIATGYGENQGVAHRSKSINQVADDIENSPQWFINGVKAALLAPTARNMQKFSFELVGEKVSVKVNSGIFSDIDRGIIRLHFEIGSGKDASIWNCQISSMQF